MSEGYEGHYEGGEDQYEGGHYDGGHEESPFEAADLIGKSLTDVAHYDFTPEEYGEHNEHDEHDAKKEYAEYDGKEHEGKDYEGKDYEGSEHDDEYVPGYAEKETAR
jgi:hypothetical protein